VERPVAPDHDRRKTVLPQFRRSHGAPGVLVPENKKDVRLHRRLTTAQVRPKRMDGGIDAHGESAKIAKRGQENFG
jgi:hypothetical protein